MFGILVSLSCCFSQDAIFHQIVGKAVGFYVKNSLLAHASFLRSKTMNFIVNLKLFQNVVLYALAASKNRFDARHKLS